MDAQFKNSLTFCNLTGPDPADVEIPLQELQFFLEQFLVVPPRFHPLLPGNIIQCIIEHYLEEYHALKLSYYQNIYQNLKMMILRLNNIPLGRISFLFHFVPS